MSITEILKLPVSDRLRMVGQIWDSLHPEDIETTKAQKEELDSRISLDQAGKMTWLSMEEVKQRLENKNEF